jgi:hypothetical protein
VNTPVVPPAAGLAEVERVPAPWSLRGHAWIVLLHLPRHAPARTAFLDAALAPSLRAGVSALMCVEYLSAPCGAYREVLFIPGTTYFDDSRRHATISRILVSTWQSVVSGRANWGIPKDCADFQLVRGAELDRFAVSSEGRPVCSVEFEPPRGPRLPFRSSWLPAGWRTLAQVHDGRTFHYEPRASGSLRFARMLRWQCDPARFPDLEAATVLASVRVDDFTMEFPVALTTGH